MSYRPRLLALALSASFGATHAQTVPDAGQTLQQQAPVLQAPKPAQDIRIERPIAASVQPGGAQVMLQSVSISGASVFTEQQLLAVLGDVSGKAFDLAGLLALAERISAHYQANGYPFANAIIPAQTAAGGVLRIEVIEGKYGQVQATGEKALAAAAQDFLQSLKPNMVIDTASLERATLVFDDLPGVRASPVIRPGQTTGTGDMDVAVQRTARYAGSAALDNHGNRYTGQTRTSANLDINSPFMLGDQISARVQATEQSMWFGNLGYSMPAGGSGLRVQAGYAKTSYELGKEFASLNATGTATVASVGVSYPLVRSQKTNLNLSANWQAKELNDKQGQAGTSATKNSDSLPLTLAFDRRDSLGAGGITYGSFTTTAGNLRLDSASATTDATTAQSNGSFTKLNLDIARIQALPAGWSIYGRAAAQWASKNLDSSEKMTLGGPGAVRAFPLGEGGGDEGWMTQLELRYTAGEWSPYVFADTGKTSTNAKPWTTGNNKRSISGAGVGTRYTRGSWNMDVVVSWRTNGGTPQSDTQASDPQGWLALAYKF